MRIYLLLIDDEQFFFYSDESEWEDAVPPSTPPAGLRGWVEGKWRRFQAAWKEADDGVALWARRTWDWLHSRVHPDEAMLMRFRSARKLELSHPASRGRDDVAAIWRGYLRRRQRRHLASAAVNGVLAIPTMAILWALPGPNIIGYWFGYRAIHHILILVGIRRVRDGRITTTYHPVAELDSPIRVDDDGKVGHAAIGGEAARLGEYVARSATAASLVQADASRPATEPSTGVDSQPARDR